MAAAASLMVAKVFAAADGSRRLMYHWWTLGLDDIEIGDDVQVTKAWLALPQKKDALGGN